VKCLSGISTPWDKGSNNNSNRYCQGRFDCFSDSWATTREVSEIEAVLRVRESRASALVHFVISANTLGNGSYVISHRFFFNLYKTLIVLLIYFTSVVHVYNLTCKVLHFVLYYR
jgi:hypothetical protein